MSNLILPHDALVFVGDGQKALFLRNAGTEKSPNLTTERVFVEENPPTREQGTDRPGRAFKSAGTTRRSSQGPRHRGSAAYARRFARRPPRRCEGADTCRNWQGLDQPSRRRDRTSPRWMITGERQERAAKA